MVQALFVLLMAAGIAIAWHSNPLYSLGRTIRFLVLTAASVAALVGAVLGVVQLSSGMSTTVGGLALGVTVLLGTVFFIWTMITASTPRPPSLSRGTPLVTVNRAHVAPWYRRLAIAIVLWIALGLLTHGEARDVVLVIGGMFVGLAVVMVFTLYVAALGMDRSLTTVEAAPWIRWTYAPETWAAWRDALIARTPVPRAWVWSRDWKTFVIPYVVAAGGMTFYWRTSVPLSIAAEIFLAIGLVIVATIELANRLEASAANRLRRTLLRAPAETYAGEAGIFCDGMYLAWMTPAKYLVSAAIDDGPLPSIDLTFEEIVVGQATTVRSTQSVLLPPNAEDDLRVLQAHLAATCPSAAVALVP
jgi:hypothetical protein